MWECGQVAMKWPLLSWAASKDQIAHPSQPLAPHSPPPPAPPLLVCISYRTSARTSETAAQLMSRAQMGQPSVNVGTTAAAGAVTAGAACTTQVGESCPLPPHNCRCEALR